MMNTYRNLNRSPYKLLVLVVLSLFILVSQVYAQTPDLGSSPPVTTPPVSGPETQSTAIPGEETLSDTKELTFAQLKQPGFELRSPISQQAFSFEVPRRWLINGGASYIEVHYDMQHDDSVGVDAATEVSLIDAFVNVYVNDTLAGAFTPERGINHTYRIAFPDEAIQTENRGRHRIRFVYYSGNCEDGRAERSVVVIEPHSFIHFEYGLDLLQVDLADFPYPLVQDVFNPDPILIVIPDEYSEADLAAAASVAATLGQRAYYDISLDIVPATEATPARLANTSVIIIGQPKDNALLLDLYRQNRLPTTLDPGNSLINASANQLISPEDGVLQAVVSDINDNYVYLIVTGGSDAAVVRATKALSILAPRYGFDGNLVVITEYQETQAERTYSPQAFTLADLGFWDVTMYGSEIQNSSARIFIPVDWRLTEKPRLSLAYVHSAMLASNSNLTVKVNNRPVASLPIDNTIVGERKVAIELSPADLRPGRHNYLGFQANLALDLPECAQPELDAAWLRIYETSELHVPHTVEQADIAKTLDDPFTLFTSTQDLTDVLFSLPENPTPMQLLGLVRVASWLGSIGLGPGFAPRVSLGAVEDNDELESYHLIVFGLPTENPVLAQINEHLPQPFIADTNDLRQEVGNVTYSLPADFGIGLLQVVAAPWNPKKTVLAVTGTNGEGVEAAIKALVDEESYYELDGDVAFIHKNRIETFDTSEFIRGPLTTAIEVLTGDAAGASLEVVAATVTVPAPAASAEVSDTPIAQNHASIPVSSALMITWWSAGLIGAGLVIATLGGIISWRRSKTR